MSTETSRQIEERALTWLARQESGEWSEAEQSEFSDWLRQTTAHRVTYLRVRTHWERTSRLKAFGVGRTLGVVPPPGEWRGSPYFERRPARAMRPALKTSRSKMAAAAIVLLLGLGVYVRIFVAGEAYATPVGGVSSIPLQDGSSVTLNTATKVRVSLTDRERHIELEAGEAFFVVAKDPSRPFVVTVGNRRVVAVGTRFSVRREGEDIQVVVTEGKVRIEPREDGQAAQLLSAGAVVQTERNAVRVEQRSLGAAEAALSWRGGYLIFNDTALADAVAELNRYTSRRIVIDDPALAGLKISGKFQSTLATDFVKLLRDGFGVEVRDHGGTVHLSSREGLMNSVPP